ncbi:MAG: malto-oligosyltrehalose synthase, partial [Methylomonas sp.]
MNNKPFPRAVYRLQLNREFKFDDAHRIVPYLHSLGISHLYVSPCLKSRAGSTHGYDIVDHSSLNPELGGSDAFARLIDQLHAYGMGLILDIVPNHMGLGSGENGWWLDVLENGQASAYATYFDIDWHPIRESLRGKVLLPILADHYGKALEAGKLSLAFDEKRGEFGVYYCDRRLPLDPETYPIILMHETEQFTALANAESHALLEWHSLMTDFEQLRQVRAAPIERARFAAACKQRLAALCSQSPYARAFVAEMISLFNGEPGKPESFDRLHELLELQSFRLAYWRVAADEINYRRFFDINDLICLRQQIPKVFEATHKLILTLIAEGNVDGVRIDHIDGLWNPRAYCERLQNEFRHIAAQEPDRVFTVDDQPLYLLVEKILAGYEHLPGDWPIAGTTGYEFSNLVNGLFVHAPSEAKITKIYHRFIGERLEFDEVLYDRKRQVIKTQMSNQLTTLVNLLAGIAESERTTRDYSINGLRDAILEVVAHFPVYRTYLFADEIHEEDCRFAEWAIAQAKKRSPATDITIFDFIRDVLLLRNLEEHSAEYVGLVLQFVMRFQQYTAPVMAKGMEDTSFYVYNRLVSLNDVGGDPSRFGTSIAAFHHANQQRLKQWPLSLITLSTHDSKRSADVRARINVLSELAMDWRQHQSRWRRLNRNKKRRVETLLAPSLNGEYLLYQTLLGTWPLEALDAETLQSFAARIDDYMQKAIKEAKIHTSWINP